MLGLMSELYNQKADEYRRNAEFVEKNPGYNRGYMWLLDELIADHRLEEAKQYLTKMASIDDSFRTDLVEGQILWADGKQLEARKI